MRKKTKSMAKGLGFTFAAGLASPFAIETPLAKKLRKKSNKYHF